MDCRKAEVMALDLMRHHGVGHMAFGWNQQKRSHGLCRYNQLGVAYKIELSRPVTEVNAEETVLNTILHEIAHALAGPGAHHGWKWKSIAVSIGAAPERCAESTVRPAGKYALVCSSCGKRVTMYRRPKRRKACGQCCNKLNYGRFDERFVLRLEVA